MQFRELRGDVWAPFNTLPGTAAGAAVEWPIFVAPWPLKITAVRFVPLAAITANATNYATLSLRNRTGAGAGTAVPASRAWSATNSVALVSENMTLSGTATDLNFAAGDVMTLGIVHTGTGLAIPVFTVQVTVRGN